MNKNKQHYFIIVIILVVSGWSVYSIQSIPPSLKSTDITQPKAQTNHSVIRTNTKHHNNNSYSRPVSTPTSDNIKQALTSMHSSIRHGDNRSPKRLTTPPYYLAKNTDIGTSPLKNNYLKQQEQLRKARMPLIKNQLNQHINSIESHIEQQTNIKENELDQALEAKQKLLWLQQEINYYE
ncbi:MAG: hypothetical protein HON94_05990 [Methylococcales bacterium]|nr:hypothetical protein [Methylococcales bacterium]